MRSCPAGIAENTRHLGLIHLQLPSRGLWVLDGKMRDTKMSQDLSHSCCLLLFLSMTYFHVLFLLLLFQELPAAVCLPPWSAWCPYTTSPAVLLACLSSWGALSTFSPGVPFHSPPTWHLRDLDRGNCEPTHSFTAFSPASPVGFHFPFPGHIQTHLRIYRN